MTTAFNSSAMLFLTVVRHGQTTSNLAHIIHTHGGGELTERGISMAKALGQHLKFELFTRIYVSDYKRAQDTAANIVAQLKTPVPTITDEPLLRERNIGDWEKQDMQLLADKLLELELPPHRIHSLDAPGCETYGRCKDRAGQFFQQYCKLADEMKETQDENILVVSHAWFISCLFDCIWDSPNCYELNMPRQNFDKTPENTCSTKFTIRKKDPGTGKRKLIFSRVYDTTHLQYLE